MKGPREVYFFHPVLGIGGAERLLLQLAEAMEAGGWTPVFWVNRYHASHAFPEARRFRVRVIDARIPENPGGRIRFWSAYLRLRAAIRAAARERRPALAVLDLVPHLIPEVKRAWPGLPVLGYCHFPDRFLAAPTRNPLYRVYRSGIDNRERTGWLAADRVLTNSAFTRRVLLDAVPDLDDQRVDVLYPAVRECVEPGGRQEGGAHGARDRILVLGRFDPRKNQELAVDALVSLFQHPQTPPRLRAVVTGGLDGRDPQALAYLDRLRRRAFAAGPGADRIEFHPNLSDAAMEAHWSRALALVYPPLAEHFGIVPLEAMIRGVPVLAVNRGGPAEIIESGRSGLLLAPEPAAFADALLRLSRDAAQWAALSAGGRDRARRAFGFERFKTAVAGVLRDLVKA